MGSRDLINRFGVEKEFSTKQAIDFCYPHSITQEGRYFFIDAPNVWTKRRYFNSISKAKRAFSKAANAKWARELRTNARHESFAELGGYYLCCIGNNKDRLMFSNQPHNLTEQFQRGRSHLRGGIGTMIPLTRCLIRAGTSDEFIDMDGWLHDYLRWERMHDTRIELEDMKRDLEHREQAVSQKEQSLKRKAA